MNSVDQKASNGVKPYCVKSRPSFSKIPLVCLSRRKARGCDFASHNRQANGAFGNAPMIVHIHKRETPFVQIDKTCLQDPNLSFKAKGVLAYLLSKPEGWRANYQDIVNHGRDGTESVRSGMAELAKAGYAKLNRIRGEKGQLLGQEWHVYEQPQNMTSNPVKSPISTENRETRVSANLSLGESHTSNNKGIDNEERNKEGNENGKEAPLSTSRRISLEKYLERLDNRLGELKDADFPHALEERKTLKIERIEVRRLLGVKV